MKRLLILSIWSFSATQGAMAQFELRNAPLSYETAVMEDRIAKLQTRLRAGDVTLQRDSRWGWLPSLLQQLNVSADSQTLVFSRTSLQIFQISPSNPRAMYFNDDAYIGWIPGADKIELSAVDPQRGAVFYTLSQKSTRPDFVRDRGECLACHATFRTKQVPGFLVRSVYPGPDGRPYFNLGTQTTDHRTPFDERFGGWYVTGTHGTMRHRGNAIARNRRNDPIDNEPGANRESLKGLFPSSNYMVEGSDIVALMVLEHQSQMHNLITRAAYEAMTAEHYDRTMNRLLEREPDYRSDSTKRRIAKAVERLLEYTLFSGEAPLTAPVHGTSGFAKRFEKLGPRDSQGRSLRDFDLRTRMFRFPCSYLVYSPSFDALPTSVMRLLKRRLREVLDGDDESPPFAHLTLAMRREIHEILRETKPELFAKE